MFVPASGAAIIFVKFSRSPFAGALIFAGIHLAFAFPFLSKILVLFAMDNVLLTAIVNLICFAVFGFFYAIVYKITSNSYYTIVSGRKENN